ncbi:MAG: HNH endonuclease [Mesorhizobium sp.]|uniref:HNH endonuclease n=1 Tax=Mesorhizobium sp. TaxID=1871066 RepID=UPI000FE4DF58|nr:MAG: HNH endonuclease [Mesorhizobium sp.]
MGKKKRSKIPQRRHDLAVSQGFRCCYCGEKFTKAGTPGAATLEHRNPKMHGGTNARENLAAACQKCNQDRGRRMQMAKQRKEKAKGAALLTSIQPQTAE